MRDGPTVRFREEEGKVILSLAYPKGPDDPDGKLIKVELTMNETTSGLMACAKALNYWGRQMS